VALHLAVRAHNRSTLNLDEGADGRVVADGAAVEVRERTDNDVLAELDVRDLAERRIVDRAVSD
jgi:hypothetical protein